MSCSSSRGKNLQFTIIFLPSIHTFAEQPTNNGITILATYSLQIRLMLYKTGMTVVFIVPIQTVIEQQYCTESIKFFEALINKRKEQHALVTQSS